MAAFGGCAAYAWWGEPNWLQLERVEIPIPGLPAGLDGLRIVQLSALARIPAGAPVILLAHEPDYADTVAADGRVALQLSGHSHGGQVHLPLIGAPVVPYLGAKYVSGLYSVDGSMWVYTNRGIGSIPPAVRFNCRPEITHITLRPAS